MRARRYGSNQIAMRPSATAMPVPAPSVEAVEPLDHEDERDGGTEIRLGQDQ